MLLTIVTLLRKLESQEQFLFVYLFIFSLVCPAYHQQQLHAAQKHVRCRHCRKMS